MTTLTRASQQLFKRSPDERFGSLDELHGHCLREKQFSTEHWQGGGPQKIRLLHLFLPFPPRHPSSEYATRPQGSRVTR